jgi:hypothetical protein
MGRTQAQVPIEIVEKYIAAGHEWPATSRRIAEWAIQTNEWKPPHASLVNLCADQIARAMSEQYYTDPQGRRVRAKHARKTKEGGKQLYLWDDIRTADPEHMEIAFQQRREQIVADCAQLKIDVDSYNENRKPESPIQIVFNFTDDLIELEFASA